MSTQTLHGYEYGTYSDYPTTVEKAKISNNSRGINKSTDIYDELKDLKPPPTN